MGILEEVDIELKRINLLIGEQSSGKSTINKVACYCSWVEKEICMMQSAEYFEQPGAFESRLVEFHKLEGFIKSDTYVEYETDVLRFSFSKKDEQLRFEWKARWSYKRPKTIYIPAERNIVAAIPNWFDVKLKENNIRSYMSDWEEARSFYADHPIKILNLGVQYAFDKNTRKDTIVISEGQQLDFTNVSSGLQSLIPLWVLLKYVSHAVYQVGKKESVKGKAREEGLITNIQRFINEKNPNVIKRSTNRKIEEERTIYRGGSMSLINIDDFLLKFSTQEDAEEAERLFGSYAHLHYANIFLEEPEQNLYPVTQRDLIYELVALTNASRPHNVFITTHSPYILTSLNNLLYAAEVGKKKPEKVSAFIPREHWVEFEEVGAWFVKHGKVVTILDDELKQIKAEKIDEVSHLLNEDYDKLLDLEYEAD